MADGGGASLPRDPLTQVILGLTSGVQAGLNGRQQQAGAEKQQEWLSHGGTDPSYIVNMEAFEGFSHEEIYDAVQQMQPGVMQQFGDQWVSMSVEISGAVAGLMIQTARAAASLQGATASAGEAAGKRFVTEATDVSTVLSAAGRRVKAAAFGSEAVKASVPPPVSSTGVTTSGDTAIPPALEVLVNGSTPRNAADAARQNEELRQQAITAMNTTYKPTYQPAGDNVPSFVAPTQPGTNESNGLGLGSGNGGSGLGGDGAGTRTGAGNDGADDSEAEGAQATAPGEEAVFSGFGQGDDSSVDGTQGQDGGASPANTSPAATSPASTNPAATSLGSGGSGGSGGAGSGLGGALSSGAPAPGRSLAGAGPNAAAMGTSGAAAGAAAGAGRGMGMGGMGAPGARGRGDDQQEHSIPDYLRGIQPELLGPDHPAVSGAIGADAPATRLADQDAEER